MNSMAKRQSTAPSPAGPFFAGYLAGENPLSGSTTQAIYDLSRQLFQHNPWRLIAGDDPFVLDLDPEAPPVYATVLGSGGEIFGLKVYENLAAQAFLHDLLDQQPHAMEHFLLRRQILSLEYTHRRDLDPPDRELLEAMGHAKTTAPNYPLFRAGRPGAHDWYLTEEEGVRFRAMLEALVWTFTGNTPEAITGIFDQGGWPVLRRRDGQFTLQPGPVPARPVIRPDPASEPLPEALAELRTFAAQRSGAMEMEAVVTHAVIGEKHERPSFLIVILAVDATTGMVLAPEAAKAADSIAPAFVRVLTQAAKGAGALPSAIHHAGSLHVIKPLLDALGIPLEQRQDLPKFQAAVGGLLEHLGA